MTLLADNERPAPQRRGEFEIELRHYCRNPKCRMKLKQPVANPANAFCCRGCEGGFYRSRCVVCEGPLERKTEGQKLCGKRKCRLAWERSQYYKRAGTAAAPKHPLKTSIKLGIKTAPRRSSTIFAKPPLNILGDAFRWPNANSIDRQVLRAIIAAEIDTPEPQAALPPAGNHVLPDDLSIPLLLRRVPA